MDCSWEFVGQWHGEIDISYCGPTCKNNEPTYDLALCATWETSISVHLFSMQYQICSLFSQIHLFNQLSHSNPNIIFLLTLAKSKGVLTKKWTELSSLCGMQWLQVHYRSCKVFCSTRPYVMPITFRNMEWLVQRHLSWIVNTSTPYHVICYI